MKTRIAKVIVGWNVVVVMLLLVSAAANVNLVEAANDPPVKLFDSAFDVNGGAADQNTADMLVDDFGNFIIAQVDVSLPAAKPHMCIATGSAEVEHLSGQGLYTVSLRRAGEFVLEPSVRRFELINNPGIEDPKYKEVSTIGAWTELTGDNTFYLYASKTEQVHPDFNVTNASLTLICVKKVL